MVLPRQNQVILVAPHDLDDGAMVCGPVLQHKYLGCSTSLSGVLCLANSAMGQVLVSQHMNPAWHPPINLSLSALSGLVNPKCTGLVHHLSL